MRYIDESLAPGETVLRRGKWPMIFWVGAWAALVFLGIIIVGVFIFIGSVMKMTTTDFAVTNRRVILKRGWLSRHTQELAVESIEGVLLNQSIIERLFGYGRVIVTGTGDAMITFPPMAHPVDFRRAIENAREQSSQPHVERVVEVERERGPANDAVVEDEAVVAEERPRRGKRSFIGLRAR